MWLGKLTRLDLTPVGWLSCKTATQTNKLIIIYYFSQKTGFEFCANCLQSECHLLKILPRVLRVKIIPILSTPLAHLFPRFAGIDRGRGAPMKEGWWCEPPFCMFLSFKGNWYTERRGNSVKMFLPPLWIGVYSKRKEFAPLVCKVFPFRVDPFAEEGSTFLKSGLLKKERICSLWETPFQKGLGVQESKQEVSLLQNGGRLPMYPIPLELFVLVCCQDVPVLCLTREVCGSLQVVHVDRYHV